MKRGLPDWIVVFLTALAFAFASPALADPSKAELAAVQAAQERGAETFAYDQAAWHSTDAMQQDLAKQGRSIESFRAKGFAGFIVEPAGDGLLLVTYYGVQDGKTFALARYWMRGKQVVRGGPLNKGDDPTLSSLALRLVGIREKLYDAAIADKVGMCTRTTPNTVILPPRADGTIPAYMMSSQAKTGSFPAGGHHLYVFDANGKVISKRAFAKSCLSIDWDAMPGDAAGFGLSHMLDPQPTEIHAFISRMMPMPLFVITDSNRSLWQVDDGVITYKQKMKQGDLPGD